VPRFVIQILLLSCLVLAACGQGVSDLMAEGDQYMKDGNYQGAIVIYKTVLENAPETMDARLALAQAYLGAGKMEQAEKNFEKYLRQNPYDKSVLLDMAKLSGYRKDNQGAIDQLQEYLKENSNSSEAYELLGKNYWLVGAKSQARASFEKAIEVAPDEATPKLAMAQYYMAEGQQDEARSYIDAILEKDPTQNDALHYRARELLDAGDTAGYHEILQTILKHHPNDHYSKYALAKVMISQKNQDEALNMANQLLLEAPRSGYAQRIKGLVHYENKEYKDAIDAYLESVAIRPDLESYLYLGLSQYGAGDLETAISNLRIAAERSTKMIKAREMISLILLQQKRYNESIAEAEKILAIEPDNVVARVIMGDVYSAQGEADKALEQLKEITERDPNYVAAFLKMGALYFAQGDLSESEAALQGAMKAAPDSLRPRLVLSDFYLKSGKMGMARKVLDQGLTGGKEDVSIYVYLARMELAENRPGEARKHLVKAKAISDSTPAPYMIMASIALAEKKPELAIEEYDALLEKQPGFLRAQLAKAVTLETLQRPEEAEAVYKDSLASKNHMAFMAYSSFKRKSGDEEGALAVINQGLGINSGEPELLKAKADVLLALKRFDEVLVMTKELESYSQVAAYTLRVRTHMLNKDVEAAITTARELTDFNPKSVQGHLLLADVYMSARRSEEWGKALQDGVAKCGPDSSLLIELSRYYASTGDYNKALNYLDSVVGSNDRLFKAHSMRGDIYYQMGRTDDAVDNYRQALKLNQEYVPALNNLAMIYLDDSKTASVALRLAYKAYVQVPWNASVMDTFGYALAVNGKKDEAVSVLEKVANVQKDNPIVNYHLGYAYYKAGKKKQARELLKLVAECTECENASDARKLLKKIN